MAVDLVTRSPTDPRTLNRAARDFAEKQPQFTLAVGLASLRWIAMGQGYDITGGDLLDAYLAVMRAAPGAGADSHQIRAQIRDLISEAPTGNQFMATVLALHLMS